jgi:hypothetical protein
MSGGKPHYLKIRNISGQLFAVVPEAVTVYKIETLCLFAAPENFA